MKYLITGLIALTLAITASPAQAHYVSSCKGNRCKHHVIYPYETGFLRTVGHCESRNGYPYGGRHGELKRGIRTNTGNGYYGRYQFGYPDWRRAGGFGYPHNATWLEQAYRAVVWLHRNGRQSWPNC